MEGGIRGLMKHSETPLFKFQANVHILQMPSAQFSKNSALVLNHDTIAEIAADMNPGKCES